MIRLSIPALALACYFALIVLIIFRRGVRGKVSQIFILYVATMAAWQFGGLMLTLAGDAESALPWMVLMLTTGFVSYSLYYFFIQVFLRTRMPKIVSYIACLSPLIVLLSTLYDLRFLFPVVYQDEYTGLYVPQFGPILYISAVSAYFIIGYAVFHLVQAYREARTGFQRNRLKYLLLGIGLVLVGNLINFVPLLKGYPIDIAANLVNALLIAYAILRYQLLDITLVIRKGLLYSIPTAIIGIAYFLLISLAVRLFHTLAGLQIFLLSLVVAAMAAVVAQPLRDKAQSWVDRLFFREKYDSRLMLQRLSGAAASILDLDRLTGMILDEVTTAMHIERAAFFLKQDESGESRLMAQKGLDQNADLRLRKDHPIVDWLSSHDHALTRHDVDVMPQFKALWGNEREDLDRMGGELFIPLKAKGQLVGIFAVGPKLSEETYSQDDQLTLTTLANQTAVTIENARLYWELERALKELRKAHDELERRVEERTAELARANEALQVEIAERKRAEEQIKASLGEKEVLLKEIHHRVKNNLQVVSSMLQLQSRNIKDKETIEMFQESRNRVRSMALVHERLYQSRDLARVDFAKYIQSLANYLCRSYGVNTNVIQLKTNLHDVLLGVDTAIPCGLILNELVSNSLKHAFPDGREGEIHIELRSEGNGKFTLMVSDNGVGLLKDLDFRNTESLGLQLVNTLVNQLEGTIELDRRGGTTFKITFAEIKYEERQ
jgi:two-component sensor histidine kinase